MANRLTITRLEKNTNYIITLLSSTNDFQVNWNQGDDFFLQKSVGALEQHHPLPPQ